MDESKYNPPAKLTYWEMRKEIDEIEKANRKGTTTRRVEIGKTWMVSVSHPNFDSPGTRWPSERPGNTPKEAAVSYVRDLDDNDGAQIIYSDPDLAVICVVDNLLAASGKPWRVHMYQMIAIEGHFDFKNPTLSEFS